MKPSCTILVSSAGRRVGLIDCFRDSAEALGVDLRVSVPAPDLVRMSRDKLRTARFLAGHEIPVPRSGTIEAALAGAATWRWP